VGARFSAPVQTGHGAHPASYTMGTGSFPGVTNVKIQAFVSITYLPFAIRTYLLTEMRSSEYHYTYFNNVYVP
jgi:hypothetical protein